MPDDKVYSFVFFSTLEVLNLPIKGPMEDAGVTKLYEPSPTPCRYVAPAANIAGRVPLIPLSGWKLNCNIPSHVQQAQGFRLPVWLCRRSSC